MHRDCFMFTYTTDYAPGPMDPARWEPLPDCVNRTATDRPRAPNVVQGAAP